MDLDPAKSTDGKSGPRRLAAAWPWLAIGALALGLRLYHLGNEALWTDEYLTLVTARKPDLDSFWANLRHQDPHPPLFFLIMFGWVRAFADTDAMARLPAALFGAATPLVFGLMLRGIFRERCVALAGAFLMAVSPMAIWYSQEARPYSLLLLLETGALAALARDWKLSPERPGKPALLAAALATLALWTHFFGGLTCAIATVVLIARGGRGKFLYGALALLFAGAAWPAWAAVGWMDGRIAWLPESYDRTLWIDVMRAQWLGPWYSPLPFWLQRTAMLAGALAMLAGIVRIARRERPAAWILLSAFAFLFIGPVAVSFIKPIIYYGQRYMIAALPATLALGAAGVMQRWRAWRMAGCCLLALIVFCDASYLRSYYGHRHKQVWDKAAAWIAAESAPADPIFVHPYYVVEIVERYLPAGRRAMQIHDWNAAKEDFHTARGAVWIVTYGDIRPWLAANGFNGPYKIGVFETTYPPTALYVTRVTPTR